MKSLEKQLEQVLFIEALLKELITTNDVGDPLERHALNSSFKRIAFVSRSVELRYIKSTEKQTII